MFIKRIIVGPVQTNCYLVGDGETKEGVIIDPGAEPGKIFSAIKENGFAPKFILLTHNHFDHIGALENLARVLGIENKKVKDREEIKIGKLKIKSIATPGHTSDSVSFVVEMNIFSGDTLFKSGIGRTDLPACLPARQAGKAGLEGGDYEQMRKSLKRLMEFSDDFKVWPGHGEPTTIGEERRENPFL